MDEIKPTGVFLSFPGMHANGIDPQVLHSYAMKIAGVRKVWFADDELKNGPESIARIISRNNIKRMVLAGYMPGMYKAAFAAAFHDAGLDTGDIHLASFNEYAVRSMAEARASLFCAILGIPYPEARTNGMSGVVSDTLVIGAGIAGIQAALEIADSGNKVYLVEKTATIGGHMAMFDKTFPTLDCAACILTPKMVEVGQHPNIDLITMAEVQEVSGKAGNFRATILRRARHVDLKACIACGICSEKCPQSVYSEFDAGTSMRKAIYIPFPQAVPNKYLIDADNCRYIREEKCGVCQKVCPAECIDFSEKDVQFTVNVGNIVVATGFKLFDASRINEFGYGRFPNVLSSLEFERLVNAAGPTGGNIRFSTHDKKGNRIFIPEGEAPQSVALIHCVGSRDVNHNEWCSRVCCMYSLKLAHLVREKLPETEVYEYYIDMRAFGKGYEEFYNRVHSEGINIIRGRTAKVTQNGSKLRLRSEDILGGKLIEQSVDMVILSVGLEPNSDTHKIAKMLNIKQESGGWFAASAAGCDQCGTMDFGIHLAGVCQGPKDIPDSVAQGSAAAARVLQSIISGQIYKDMSGLHDIELRAKELSIIREEI